MCTEDMHLDMKQTENVKWADIILRNYADAVHSNPLESPAPWKRRRILYVQGLRNKEIPGKKWILTI